MTLQRDLPRHAPKLPSRASVAILIALLGLVLVVWGFFAGINAALDGSGSGPGVWVAVFVVGLLASVVAFVLAMIGLITGVRRVLSGVALALALLPGIGMFAIALFVQG